MAAAQHKDKGNAAFKAGDYPGAVGHYTAAILADSADPTFPLNRAAAYLKLNKNEDAERDCSTVLKLQANNIKALFRRAQARVALEKLSGARADLVAAAKAEPGNAAVRAEFTKVEELISAEAKKAKTLRGTPISVPVRPTPSATSYRRRVPINIVDDEPEPEPTTSKDESKPSTSSSSDSTKLSGEKTPLKGILKGATANTSKPSASTSATPISVPTAPRSGDLLTAVSTRAVSSSSSASLTKPPSPVQKPLTSSQTTSSSVSSAAVEPSPSPVVRSPATPISEPAIPIPAASEAAAPDAASPATSTANTNTNTNALASTLPAPTPVTLPDQPDSTAPTLVTFLQKWTNAESDGARAAVLFTVPPDSIPTLFGPTLESPLLGAMLSALAWAVSPTSNPTPTSTSIPQRALAYMRALSRVPRFTTLVMFLDPGEKQSARVVWDGIAQSGGEGADVKGDRVRWGC